MDGCGSSQNPPANISVPEYLEVDLTSSTNGRDYFTVLEGTNRGRKFSVAAGHLGAGDLNIQVRHT